MTWDDPAKAAEYLHRIGTSAPRQAGEDVLREVLPPAPTSALDLGCGDDPMQLSVRVPALRNLALRGLQQLRAEPRL